METKVILDTLWVVLAGILVFFMNLGFATLESGMARSKNTVNIMSKNFIVFAVSSLGFFLLGWGLMFGDGNDFTGTRGLFFASGADNSPNTGAAYEGVYSAIAWAGVPFWVKFFFQLVFCGTAATIVSGAVAERIKYISFIVFSLILTMVIYPVAGHWIWGGGWLGQMGFLDFAGGTAVHSIGGWAALSGIMILGPRIGKYSKTGKTNAIPGHSVALATIGALILWFGWFGFNPGSTMAADPEAIGHILVVTNMAGAMGILVATVTAWIKLGKPDISMSINGLLAGLVAITPGCAYVSVTSSLMIGAIAGILVVFASLFFDKLRLDDPVGATAVHLANGIFGTLSIGLFAEAGVNGNEINGLLFGGGIKPLGVQAVGVISVGAFVFTLSTAVWLIIKKTIGLRVSVKEELNGLDIGEHGNEAYPEFLSRKFNYAQLLEDADSASEEKPAKSKAV